ncbi:unnamed protein product [Agarophyton chilense]|eukprot:gb/GEZJ01003706.1/.p1 GENE.gb/GEZJ01003706.1/~~gb/GEZJ01003706.1/.p1  ORF type:complete len:1089 (-),score=208.15 gb/GEZJ01003706.1/:1264-4530(-)
MSDDAEMDFARIEHAIKSTPQKLSQWFHDKGLDARIFFSKFCKASEQDESEKEPVDKTPKESEKLWTDTEDILGSTPLHLAVCVNEEYPGVLEETLKLIKKDEENRYLTPVYKVSSTGDFDWEATDNDGFTPLSLAIRKNDTNALGVLLEMGCKADLRCSVSFELDNERKEVVTNLIGLTIVLDSMNCFLALLEHGVDPLVCDSRGKLPVHVAAEYGRLDALQKLLEVMPDLHQSTKLRDTYLVREDFETYQAEEMDVSEANAFEEDDSASSNINVGASPENEIDDDELEPSGMPLSNEESHLVFGEFWEGNSIENAEFDENEEGEEEEMFTLEDILQLEREMIEAGFEVQRDRQGNITARFRGREDESQIKTGRGDCDYGSNLLHLAVKNKQYDICHFLLTAVKNIQGIEDRRDDGMTAMHIAARNDDTKMMQLLIEKGGAQIDSCNDILGVYPIHLCCETGASQALKFLIDHGADPNCRDDNEFVPLHYAAACEESTECINHLLEAQADVNAVSLAIETPVYTAVSRWNMTQFWKILRAGGDPSIAHSDTTVVLGFLAANSTEELANFAAYLVETPSVKNACNLNIVIGDEGQTALHIAARNLSTKAVENLLKAGADPNNEDENGLSPLLTAMEHSNGNKVDLCTCMNLLLKAGADSNKIVPDGPRPLHFACKKKYHQLVEQLIESGAELDATSKSETALHVAAETEDSHSMKLLLEAGAHPNVLNEEKLSPLLLCARNQFVDGVRVLTETGADIKTSTPEGNTCLHVCAERRRGNVREVINILVGAGASLDAFNSIGDQPLHVHIFEHRTDGVQSLITAGAKINALSKSDRSPLMMACDRGHLEAVRMLIRAGANVNLENKSEHTALYYFAGSESKTVRALRLLLNAGANINHRDKDGDTVLHEAALNDHPAVIRFLLHRGVDINSCNKAHETPLFQAATNGFVEATEALLRNYPTVRAANPKICDKSGTSPYEAARIGGHTEVMQLLLQSMKVTLSTFAPLSVYALNSPAESGAAKIETEPSIPTDKTICAICQEDLEIGEQIRKLPCGHEYHDPCILPWIGGEQMSQHMNCPVCKQPIAPEVL